MVLTVQVQDQLGAVTESIYGLNGDVALVLVLGEELVSSAENATAIASQRLDVLADSVGSLDSRTEFKAVDEVLSSLQTISDQASAVARSS